GGRLHCVAVVDSSGARPDARRGAPPPPGLLLGLGWGGGAPPAVAGGVRDLRIPGIDGDVAALAAADHPPVLARDPASRGPAGERHARVVLLAAVDAVRKLGVDRDAVDLRRRLVPLRRPGPAAVDP